MSTILCEDVRTVPTFRERFLFLKEEKQVSLDDIATAIGSSKSSLSKFLSGKSRIRQEMLEDLAKYFDVDVAYLIGESDIRRKTIEYFVNHAYFDVVESAKLKGISPEKLKKIIDVL